MVTTESSLADLMTHAGFRRAGRSWRRRLGGREYVAETAARRCPTDVLAPITVREVDAFPAAINHYDTALHMALTWAGR